MKQPENDRMNRICRFCDPKLEDAFLKDYFRRQRVFFACAFFLVGAVFLAFFLTDLGRGLSFRLLVMIGVTRLIMSLVSIVFGVYLLLAGTSRAYSILIWPITAAFIVSYLITVCLSGQTVFLIKCMDIILINAAIFFLSIDWGESLALAFCSLTGTFLFFYIDFPQRGDLAVGAVYLLLFFMFDTMVSYRMRYYLHLVYRDSLIQTRLIYTDQLTGCANRNQFDRDCGRLMAQASWAGTPLALGVIDIDDFKRINDTYGHLTGDKMLTMLCETTVGTLKPGETFARWGGEEFVLLMPGLSPDAATARAETVRAIIAETSKSTGITLSCSIGVTSLLAGDTLSSFFDRADRQLYVAKRAGKNLVVYG